MSTSSRLSVLRQDWPVQRHFNLLTLRAMSTNFTLTDLIHKRYPELSPHHSSPSAFKFVDQSRCQYAFLSTVCHLSYVLSSNIEKSVWKPDGAYRKSLSQKSSHFSPSESLTAHQNGLSAISVRYGIQFFFGLLSFLRFCLHRKQMTWS